MARIDEYLVTVSETGASDLHLTAQHPPMLRLHGQIMKLQGEGRLSTEQIQELLFEIMPERNRREYEERNDTDFAYEVEGLARFRVNVFTDRYGCGAVMRIIPHRILTLAELGIEGTAIRDFCYLSKGLVVVTGPTGSGKSTTLAAMVDHINRSRSEHIITIEDPIEFVHPSIRCLVNQREVAVHTNTFKAALRAALREAPDIVLVGELRDLETIAIAIETAETGHVVFGTLHTNTASSTVDRIIDQFPSTQQAQIRTMLAASLKGVVAQTLLRKKDGGGRQAAFEILVVTPAVASNIREGKTHALPSAIQTGRKHGMVSLNDSILEHVLAGTVSPEEGYLKAIDKSSLQARYLQSGIPFDPSQLAQAEVEQSAPEEGGGAAGGEDDDPGRRVHIAADAGRPRPSARAAKRKVYDDFEKFRAQRSTEGPSETWLDRMPDK